MLTFGCPVKLSDSTRHIAGLPVYDLPALKQSVTTGDQRSTNRVPTGLTCSHAVFAHALGYRTIYRATLVKSAGVLVADRLRKVLRVVIAADLNARPLPEHRDDVPLTARIKFLLWRLCRR